MNEDFLTLARQTASKALASAVVELFPKALLVQGSGTSKYFYYDFILPFELQNDALSVIEERLRLKLKQKPAIRSVEMMPKNAAVRMEHQDQPFVAERIRDLGQGLVQMIEINGFVDWCEEEFLQEWDHRLVFKLIEHCPIEVGDRKGCRIIGVLSPEKDTLKESIKNAPLYSQASHQALCERYQIAAASPCLGEGLWSWLPAGEKLRQAWIDWWKRSHVQQNFQLMTTPSCLVPVEGFDPGLAMTLSHAESFFNTGNKRLAEVSYVYQGQKMPTNEGLLDVAGGMTDRAHIFCPEGELLNECISSLHFIAKIPKILCFEFQIVLYTVKGAKGLRLLQQALNESGLDYTTQVSLQLEEGESRISVCLSDSLGRWWEGPFMSIGPVPGRRSGGFMLKRSALGSLERLVALQLERCAGGNAASVDDFLKTMNALNWSKDPESEN
ncbi:MAG: hypothetical protein K2P51_02840 [Rhabdochlamydiaceae bacterium]|nr:hypothetical protein [Rhabdochlamydiaceae bacterium]